MLNVRSATRRVFCILLVVVMLLATVGSGVASASTTTGSAERGTPTANWAGLCNYTVRPGDTLSQIAVRFHTTTWYLATINHIANPNKIRSGMHLFVPCVTPTPPRPVGCVYLVKPGDTLSRIALRFGTTSAYLAYINHLSNPNKIYSWTYLRVPCWDP